MRISLAISFVCGLIGLATPIAQATNLQVLYAFDRTTAQAHQEIKERFRSDADILGNLFRLWADRPRHTHRAGHQPAGPLRLRPDDGSGTSGNQGALPI